MRHFLIFIIAFFLIITTNHAQKTSKLQYKSFEEFYNFLYKGHELTVTNLQMKDTLTKIKPISRDSIQTIFSFTLDKWKLKFFSSKKTHDFAVFDNHEYILINNRRIIPDSISQFGRLFPTRALEINLNGTLFLILNSWAPDCNGKACLINVDQFFQIKDKKISYQLIEGWQQPSNIYCDLNNDGQLDLITFAGECLSKLKDESDNNSDSYVYCVQALTLQKNNWIPLTDKMGKPYFISLHVDDIYETKKFKVLDYHWMKEL